MSWKTPAVLLVIAAAGGLSLANKWTRPVVLKAWESTREMARKSVAPAHGEGEPAAEHPEDPPRDRGPWDGRVALDEAQREALGVRIAEVKPQIEPITLELYGTTAYDDTTQTKIRPRFDTLVDKVYATVGQQVKKGEPLVDLYSAELAQAKTDYETAYTQWKHDKNLVEVRKPLIDRGTITQQLWQDTINDEMKSKLQFKVARDKLLVYGLTDQEIEQIEKEDRTKKAQMTLYSPTDGVVISRDVVQGNLYDINDTLMVINTLDHLWVWGNVYEYDLDLVEVGQVWEIQFPYLHQTIKGTVNYVANQVDPGTHAVKIRASIPNPGGKLKADMLVRAMLEIPPVEGRTVVPRIAMVTVDRGSYVFVQDKDRPEAFERRTVRVAHEGSDQVVISDGLLAGELVATNGSLVLNQIYEDKAAVETGTPQ